MFTVAASTDSRGANLPAVLDGTGVLVDNLMTAAEVAEYLRLTPKAVRDLAACGRLPAIDLSRGTSARAQWRFRRVELDRWLAGRESTAAEVLARSRRLRAV